MPVRVASMALHSTSSTRLRARETVAVMISSTSASLLRIWYSRWIGDVETNVWMRPRLRMAHGLAGAVDVGGDGTRETGDRRLLHALRNRRHGLEVALGRDRESRLR